MVINGMKFSNSSWYLGRNGTFKAIGVTISKGVDEYIITPINSKDKDASCSIAIPIKDMETFIEKLQNT